MFSIRFLSIAQFSVLAWLAIYVAPTSNDWVVDLKFNPTGTDTKVEVNRKADVSTKDELTYQWDASIPLLKGDASENQVIYGGYSATGEGVVGEIKAGLQDASGSVNDYMNLENSRAAAGAMRGRALMLWDRADFKNKEATNFDTNADCMLSMTIVSWNTPDPEAVRFVIRDGTEYYLSSMAATKKGKFSLAGDAEDLKWAAFDPKRFSEYSGGGGDIGPDGKALAFSQHTFGDVTGVGFITEMERGGGGNMFFNVSEFKAKLSSNPIP